MLRAEAENTLTNFIIIAFTMVGLSYFALILSATVTALDPRLLGCAQRSTDGHDLTTHDVYSWLAQQVLEEDTLKEGEVSVASLQHQR